MINNISQYERLNESNIVDMKLYTDLFSIYRTKYVKDSEKLNTDELLTNINKIFHSYDVVFHLNKKENKKENILESDAQISDIKYDPVTDKINITVYDDYFKLLLSKDNTIFSKPLGYTLISIDEMNQHRIRWSKKNSVRKNFDKYRFKKNNLMFGKFNDVLDPRITYNDVKNNKDYIRHLAYDTVSEMVAMGWTKSRIQLELKYPDMTLYSESMAHSQAMRLFVENAKSSTIGRIKKLSYNPKIEIATQHNLYGKLLQVREDYQNTTVKTDQEIVDKLNAVLNYRLSSQLYEFVLDKKGVFASSDKSYQEEYISKIENKTDFSTNKENGEYSTIAKKIHDKYKTIDIFSKKNRKKYKTSIKNLNDVMKKDKLVNTGLKIFILEGIHNVFKKTEVDYTYDKSTKEYHMENDSLFNKFANIILNLKPKTEVENYIQDKNVIIFKPEYKYFLTYSGQYLKEYKIGFKLDIKVLAKLINMGINTSIFKYIK